MKRKVKAMISMLLLVSEVLTQAPAPGGAGDVIEVSDNQIIDSQVKVVHDSMTASPARIADKWEAERQRDACQKELAGIKTVASTFFMVGIVALLAALAIVWGARADLIGAWRRAEIQLPNNIRQLAYIFVTPVVTAGLGGSLVRMGAWFTESKAHSGIYLGVMGCFTLVGGICGILVAEDIGKKHK